MANAINTLTGSVSLYIAQAISNKVRVLWGKQSFLDEVTPTTKRLLVFWFDESFQKSRKINFHRGQREAILNTIYLHEVLKIDSVKDIYSAFEEEAKDIALTEITEIINKNSEIKDKQTAIENSYKNTLELFVNVKENQLSKEKYSFTKYAMKMATGTGKTWVMNALILWQYLNVIAEKKSSGRYSKNFLLIAPGLIVYERLVDSYKGKMTHEGIRDINSSDIVKNKDLFIPNGLEKKVINFLGNSVATKEEIGRKSTGNSLIAITNWHLFMSDNHSKDNTILDDILPVRPSKSAGSSLDVLDNQQADDKELEYLVGLEDLIVMNDEAHHIHESKTAGEIKEVEWQKALDRLQENKTFFMQVDFSATPYDVTGSGDKRMKHYFPHIVVDFPLKDAIYEGLVKLVTIDRRKKLQEELEALDYKVQRSDAGIFLSDGQKLMLNAGLEKRKRLEKEFRKYPNKSPKMLIMCEDTTVVPLVEDYLKEQGLTDEEYLGIHSNKKGEIKADEFDRLKKRLFNLDNEENLKVVISVLMLKEGFDVNSVCVIVPLRSSSSSILLEQTIGRGLRLMFREREYEEEKDENRKRVLEKKLAPLNSMDTLSIVEHPAFNKFYDDLMKDGIVVGSDGKGGEGVEWITTELKGNYTDYDMYFLEIEEDESEVIEVPSFNEMSLSSYDAHTLEKLQSMIQKGDEEFFATEMTQKTQLGSYKVAGILNAHSYNDYLQKILNEIVKNVSIKKGGKKYESLQIFQYKLIEILNRYIRTKLFNEPFDPVKDENWKIFLLSQITLNNHIRTNINRVVQTIQINTTVTPASVKKQYFSELKSLNMRKDYALDLVKTIYQYTAYPSHSGGFEKRFLEFLDRDTQVLKFIKILEFKHDFATISYLRDDGLMASYYPDFMVETKDEILIIETKADKDSENKNVLSKQKSALEYVNRINHLESSLRSNKIWKYVLLTDKLFNDLVANGANLNDMVKRSQINKAHLESRLFE